MSLDDRVADLVRRIGEAPFAPETWPEVVRDLGVLTGGWAGNLLGVSGRRVVFDVAGGVPDEVIAEFHARGGADPSANPRVRAALNAPDGVAITEPDFISDEARAKDEFYQEFFVPMETVFVLGSRMSLGDVDVYVSTERSLRQGPATEAQRRIYAVLAPALAKALRAQVRMENQCATSVLSALDLLGQAAILCDLAGRIVATSGEADRLLAAQTLVGYRGRRLAAASPDSDAKLQSALANGPTVGATASSVVLFSRDRREFAVADVLRLPPSARLLGVAAASLVVIGAPQMRPRGLLSEAGLTPAETAIAQHLVDGLSAREIAEARGSSLETVRTQTKAVYAKLGVRRRLELVARLRGLV